MSKRVVIAITIVLILLITIGGYFLFFGEKCSDEQLFNPYQEKCVSKSVLCNLESDCLLLEGQTASFSGESLTFTLISAEEGGIALININGLGEARLHDNLGEFIFGNYKIIFVSADGDKDKIIGAKFEIIKTPNNNS